MIYASLWHGARGPAQSTNGFSPKKQPAAARNGYLIVRICLLEVLPTCWNCCDPTAVRQVRGTSPNASRHDTRPANPLPTGLGNSDSSAIPSATNCLASYREATLSMVNCAHFRCIQSAPVPDFEKST